VGGSTITSSANNVTGLTIKGAVSQSANLQEWQDSSGAIVAYLDASGNFSATNVTAGSGSGADAVLTNFMLGGM
jgi:hypothetical protein